MSTIRDFKAKLHKNIYKKRFFNESLKRVDVFTVPFVLFNEMKNKSIVLTWSTKFVTLNALLISDMRFCSWVFSTCALSTFSFLIPGISLVRFSSAIRSVFCTKNGSETRTDAILYEFIRASTLKLYTAKYGRVQISRSARNKHSETISRRW